VNHVAPIEVARALNYAGRHFGFGRWNVPPATPGARYRYGGILVVPAQRFAPCAVTRRRQFALRHLTRDVLLAWHRGQVVGVLAGCWCGSRLVAPDLGGADMPASAGDCQRCAFLRGGLTQVSVQVNVTVGGAA
jgi:hypothetical protein